LNGAGEVRATIQGEKEGAGKKRRQRCAYMGTTNNWDDEYEIVERRLQRLRERRKSRCCRSEKKKRRGRTFPFREEGEKPSRKEAKNHAMKLIGWEKVTGVYGDEKANWPPEEQRGRRKETTEKMASS